MPAMRGLLLFVQSYTVFAQKTEVAFPIPSIPSPGTIVDAGICFLAEQKAFETRLAQGVCETAFARLPGVQPECEALFRAAWESLTAWCHRSTAGLAAPLPEDIERRVCEMAEKPGVEGNAVDKVCKALDTRFPKYHLEPECKLVLTHVWDSMVAKCPHSNTTLAVAVAGPGKDITKAICHSVAKHPGIEQKLSGVVCEALLSKHPEREAVCQRVVTGVLMRARAAWCNQDAQGLQLEAPKPLQAGFPLPPMPTPGAIVNDAICWIRHQKPMELRLSEAVCETVLASHPAFRPRCEALFRAVWESATAWCDSPHTDLQIGAIEANTTDSSVALPFPIPTPGKIVNAAICALAAQKPLEDRMAQGVCETLFHSLPFIIKPCEAAFRAAWEFSTSFCHGHTLEAQAPIPQGIEKIVCEVASQKQVEDRATAKVCAAIKARFPGINFKPDCQTIVEAFWDRIVARCPKETFQDTVVV